MLAITARRRGRGAALIWLCAARRGRVAVRPRLARRGGLFCAARRLTRRLAPAHQEMDKDLHSRTIAALGEDVVRAIQSSSVSHYSCSRVRLLRPRAPQARGANRARDGVRVASLQAAALRHRALCVRARGKILRGTRGVELCASPRFSARR